MSDGNKSFGQSMSDVFASKPMVALAFGGIGFIVGVLSGVVF